MVRREEGKKKEKEKRHLPHIANDGWQEETEGIEWHVAAHVDDHPEPHFIILECLYNSQLAEPLMLIGTLFIFTQTTDDADGIGVGEEFSVVGEVVYHVERGDTEDDGYDAFEDEDPGPAVFVADTY